MIVAKPDRQYQQKVSDVKKWIALFETMMSIHQLSASCGIWNLFREFLKLWTIK